MVFKSCYKHDLEFGADDKIQSLTCSARASQTDGVTDLSPNPRVARCVCLTIH